MGCSSQPWLTKGEQEMKLILENVQVVPGGHCESSAINNALNYLGYKEINESMIVGAGGAIAFMLDQSEFPFLGGRNNQMREIFFAAAGISWQVEQPATSEAAWAGVKGVLKAGLPVVLRVDMRFLPYLYGGKYGAPYMSFGGHMITLFGIDLEKEIAYVSDTALPGLHQIALLDLEKARSSNTKVYPPMREYYWIEKKPTQYQLDWQKLVAASIKEVVGNMEYKAGANTPALFGLAGLEQFSRNLKQPEKLVKNEWLFAPVLSFWYGCIETNGTGGAAFRMLYRDFIQQASEQLNSESLYQLLPYLDASITAWHNLANGFKSLSENIQTVKGKAERAPLFEQVAGLAFEVYQKEKDLCQVLKAIKLENV
jgi:hypothetical protein